MQMGDRLRLWGQKRDNPTARSASFDQSVAAQYRFDWKRTLAFAPHQDTAAMVYVNCAARHRGVKTAAPRMTPRQIDDARTAAAEALAQARHPETGSPLFPQIIATAETYQLDPTREGYPDLIALPDEPYWVRTKLTSSHSWVEPDPNLPGTHRPEGIVALAGAELPPGHHLQANLTDATPTILALLGLPIPAHIEGKPIVETRPAGPSAPPTSRLDTIRPRNASTALITSRSTIRSKSKRSSSSASPSWDTWNEVERTARKGRPQPRVDDHLQTAGAACRDRHPQHLPLRIPSHSTNRCPAGSVEGEFMTPWLY